jgi:hypothetical protein
MLSYFKSHDKYAVNSCVYDLKYHLNLTKWAHYIVITTFFVFFFNNACILQYYLSKPLTSLSCSLNAVFPMPQDAGAPLLLLQKFLT